MAEEQGELFEQPDNQMVLETTIKAEFKYSMQPTPQEQVSLDALNKHTEDVCETLQPIFQQLIIEMLELKRQTFATGG